MCFTVGAMPGVDLSRPLMGALIGFYLLGLLYVAWRSRLRVRQVDDYVLAGRRLGTWLVTPTLFATWFGAGTLLVVSDEVRQRGISAALLDPLGAGLCLILAGLLFAGPLWRLQVLTLCDVFALRFGRRIEVLSACLMVPVYFGWIAAQLVAVASILELFFGLPLGWGIGGAGLVAMAYTLGGGMWTVTLTDAAQTVLLIVGLLALAVATLWGVPAESATFNLLPGHYLELAEPGSSAMGQALGPLAVIAAGSLGNIPSQDLTQRIFAARDARSAIAGCLLAGLAYLLLGAIPVGLGLLAATDTAAPQDSVIAWLAISFMHPVLGPVFVLTVLAAVFSTLNSALLAPASVLAHNVWRPRGQPESLRRYRWAVVIVGLVSLSVAYAGESAYSLLEDSYALGLVSLFAPLCFALFTRRHATYAAAASMTAGTLLWFVHWLAGRDYLAGTDFLPIELAAFALSALTYPCIAPWASRAPASHDR